MERYLLSLTSESQFSQTHEIEVDKPQQGCSRNPEVCITGFYICADSKEDLMTASINIKIGDVYTLIYPQLYISSFKLNGEKWEFYISCTGNIIDGKSFGLHDSTDNGNLTGISLSHSNAPKINITNICKRSFINYVVYCEYKLKSDYLSNFSFDSQNMFYECGNVTALKREIRLVAKNDAMSHSVAILFPTQKYNFKLEYVTLTVHDLDINLMNAIRMKRIFKYNDFETNAPNEHNIIGGTNMHVAYIRFAKLQNMNNTNLYISINGQFCDDAGNLSSDPTKSLEYYVFVNSTFCNNRSYYHPTMTGEISLIRPKATPIADAMAELDI